MAQDAIVGARYRDDTFDAEFTISEIASEGEVPDDDDIEVVLDYDEPEMEITVTLAQFRREDSIELLDVPDQSD